MTLETGKEIVAFIAGPLFFGSWAIFTTIHIMAKQKWFGECIIDGLIGAVCISMAFCCFLSIFIS